MGRKDTHKRIKGLAIDPGSGVSIQNAAPLDNNFINVRKVADGTISNSEVINTAQLENGFIDVSECAAVAIACISVTGSLTSMSVFPEFSDNAASVFHRLGVGKQTAGAIAIREFSILLSTDISVVTIVPNPGAHFMRIVTTSSGTITNSSLIIDILRLAHFGSLFSVA